MCQVIYVSAQYAQYGVYDYETGIQLPDGYQTVYRYTKENSNCNEERSHNRIRERMMEGMVIAVLINLEYIDSLIKMYIKVYDYAKQNKN